MTDTAIPFRASRLLHDPFAPSYDPWKKHGLTLMSTRSTTINTTFDTTAADEVGRASLEEFFALMMVAKNKDLQRTSKRLAVFQALASSSGAEDSGHPSRRQGCHDRMSRNEVLIENLMEIGEIGSDQSLDEGVPKLVVVNLEATVSIWEDLTEDDGSVSSVGTQSVTTGREATN